MKEAWRNRGEGRGDVWVDERSIRKGEKEEGIKRFVNTLFFPFGRSFPLFLDYLTKPFLIKLLFRICNQ
jgi:hypothetical protein